MKINLEFNELSQAEAAEISALAAYLVGVSSDDLYWPVLYQAVKNILDDLCRDLEDDLPIDFSLLDVGISADKLFWALKENGRVNSFLETEKKNLGLDGTEQDNADSE